MSVWAEGLAGSAPLSFTVQLKAKLTQLPLGITTAVSVVKRPSKMEGETKRGNEGVEKNPPWTRADDKINSFSEKSPHFADL